MRILIASPIDPDAVKRLERDHEVTAVNTPGPEELRRLIRD